MKKFMLFILAALIVSAFVERPAPTQPNAQAQNAAAALEQKREAVKNYFISDAEPSVKDAAWTTPTTFKIGVIDDKTNRNGFAQYVCQELALRDLHDITVHVIDVVKLARDKKWIDLGVADCSK